MAGIFSVEGPLYRVLMQVYNILLLNLLWFVFSLPLFTIGASTTALFYVARKIMDNREYSTPAKDFWKSYKQNFRQATVIWLVLVLAFLITIFNIYNVHIFQSLARYIKAIYYVVLAEIIVTGVYVFPLLAKYYIKTGAALKTAFFMANRFCVTTLACLAVLPLIYYLVSWKGYLALFSVSSYALWVYYFSDKKFQVFAAGNGGPEVDAPSDI